MLDALALQLPFPDRPKVSSTARSIKFAIEGNITGLQQLFSQRLASPRDVSEPRGFSLVRVSPTFIPFVISHSIQL